MQIIIDLDGTICTEEKTFDRCNAELLPKAKLSINKLYDEGHIIIIYSARGWAEYEMTYKWLTNKGVKFHQLVLGKPIGDFWIDDRAISFKDWEKTMKEIN